MSVVRVPTDRPLRESEWDAPQSLEVSRLKTFVCRQSFSAEDNADREDP